ncbi:hypothetical protein [Bradyrhizobium sp. LTSP885]|uniref:hypothetical protein n=1 Tax=Bradyrhizobium sp. LTSP885 TaxID=1619232 RepID=UPI000B18DADE|nr:hypothetical protein [Bradyrhizobium sp. LTSP885]
MTNKTNPVEQEPGEKQPGKYHYNPGNMSGKTAEKTDTAKDESDQVNNADKKTDQPHK